MTKYQIVFVPPTYDVNNEGGYYALEEWKPHIVGIFRKRDIGRWNYLVAHLTLEAARDVLEKLKHNPYDTAEF